MKKKRFKRLKLKILFLVFYLLMLVVWIWGSFLAQNIIGFFAGENWQESEGVLNWMVAVNFIFFGISIVFFSVLFFKQMDKADKIKEQAEKERLMLFANIAHDLKTPITSVLGYSKALSDGVVTDEAKKAEYLQTITRKAVRMNDLIDRLFEYVKLESPENVLHKKDDDVAEVLRKSIANLYTDFEEKDFNLDMQIPEMPVIKNIDSLEIDRVFTNLLNNALKHNSRGTTLSISMDENGKTIIADNGNPIPSEVASQIFKPFISGDESRMSKNGSGLGLALAHKIMEKHEGSLTFVPEYTGFRKAFVVEF